MARGDVVIIELPSSELREQSGRRPAVAVQTDVAGEPMLMVAPITSPIWLRCALLSPCASSHRRRTD